LFGCDFYFFYEISHCGQGVEIHFCEVNPLVLVF
jgi:hypothetical protein